jgi:hypothetical protein
VIPEITPLVLDQPLSASAKSRSIEVECHRAECFVVGAR